MRRSNVEHKANALTWGIDNWIHVSQHGHRYQLIDRKFSNERVPVVGQWGLTRNDEGRFLFAADAPEVAFCFERGLVFPVDSVYRQLGNFRAAASAKKMTLGEVSPKATVLVSASDEFSTSVAEAAEQLMSDSSDVQVRVSRYDGDDTGAGMLIATSGNSSSLAAAVAQLPNGDLSDHELAHSLDGRRQALCAWKVYYDPARPDRFLCLVLAQPY